MINAIIFAAVLSLGICLGVCISELAFARKREQKIQEAEGYLAGARKAHEAAERHLEDVLFKNPTQVAYVCDKQYCIDGCNNSDCCHTFDVNHAKNFEYNGYGTYVEKLEESE